MDQGSQNTPTGVSETKTNSELPQPTNVHETGALVQQDTQTSGSGVQLTHHQSHHDKMLSIILGLFIVIALFITAGYILKNRNPSVAPLPVYSAKPTSEKAAVVNANNTFGTNLFNELTQQSPGTNIFISPTSIAMALSMVYNGAAGSTQSAMQQALDYQGLSSETINSSNLALINALKNPDPHVALSIANSVWLRQGVTVHQSFLRTVQNNYQAKEATLDFTSPTALATINGWVNQATNGKIPSIISSIPPAEIMYLINAVYFKGTWQTQFNPSETQEYPFTTDSGAKVQVPLMTQTGMYKYYANSVLQAIQLPYGNNGRIVMNVYLPSNMNTFLKSLNYSELASLTSEFSNQHGTILLPKFTLNYSQNLNAALKALGMSIAFDPNSANFDNIAPSLYISDVQHKTYLNVDESGTEAAAATSVGVSTSAVMAGPSFTMQVNKPFIVTIEDTQSKEILFIGMIQNPNSQ